MSRLLMIACMNAICLLIIGVASLCTGILLSFIVRCFLYGWGVIA